jgi:hypothetical protein
VKDALRRDGFAILPQEEAVLRWATVAARACQAMLDAGPDLRHGGTWCVGVDALPNAPDGSLHDVPLAGRWRALLPEVGHWHRAQLSVVFPGYPGRDAGDSDASHHWRCHRAGAHVDGLMKEGTPPRRHLREAHLFIAGLPLNDSDQAPLTIWQGSHHILRAAFATALDGLSPAQWGDCDLAPAYVAARRAVFANCPQLRITARPGQVVLLDRHLLHGVAPWGDGVAGPARQIAYFRPVGPVADWLSPSF